MIITSYFVIGRRFLKSRQVPEFRLDATGNFVNHLPTSLDSRYLRIARMLTFEMIAYFLFLCSNSSPFDLYKKTSTFVKVRTAHH